MTNIILSIIFLAIAMSAVVIRKTYMHLPAKELKRRAKNQDLHSVQAYKAVAYGNSLWGLLWGVIIIFSAIGFVLLAQKIPALISIIIVAALLWVAFSWLPSSRVSDIGESLTRLVNPTIVWLLGYLDPLFKKISSVTSNWSSKQIHTGLFERSDLLDLIDAQQHQHDSRFSDEELEIAKRALKFDDHIVGDVMTPKKRVKIISPNAVIGPILVDELHNNAVKNVLVRDSAKGPLLGFIDYTRLDLQRAGKIKDFMETTIYYIHEKDVLSTALQAFYRTNHPVLVVVNDHQDLLGILTVDNILAQLLGHIPGEEFDEYSNIEAVATKHQNIPSPDLEEQTPVNTEE